MARSITRTMLGIALLVQALLFSGCSSTGSGFAGMSGGGDSATPTMDRISSTGKLRVGLNLSRNEFDSLPKHNLLIKGINRRHSNRSLIKNLRNVGPERQRSEPIRVHWRHNCVSGTNLSTTTTAKPS